MMTPPTLGDRPNIYDQLQVHNLLDEGYAQLITRWYFTDCLDVQHLGLDISITLNDLKPKESQLTNYVNKTCRGKSPSSHAGLL